MFIQTETTPNPSTVKFLPGRPVFAGGGMDFSDPAQSLRSPLAQRLFKIPGVARVFLGADFISVSKAADLEWPHLMPVVLAAIMDHYTFGLPAMEEGGADIPQQEEDDLTRQIKILLEERVRPAVAMDGGDIVFDRFEEGVVYLHMRGACSGCPSSTATLKHGIENMLRHYVPEVREVRAA